VVNTVHSVLRCRLMHKSVTERASTFTGEHKRCAQFSVLVTARTTLVLQHAPLRVRTMAQGKRSRRNVKTHVLKVVLARVS